MEDERLTGPLDSLMGLIYYNICMFRVRWNLSGTHGLQIRLLAGCRGSSDGERASRLVTPLAAAEHH